MILKIKNITVIPYKFHGKNVFAINVKIKSDKVNEVYLVDMIQRKMKVTKVGSNIWL